jgi:hypothetical protein
VRALCAALDSLTNGERVPNLFAAIFVDSSTAVDALSPPAGPRKNKNVVTQSRSDDSKIARRFNAEYDFTQSLSHEVTTE